MATDTEILVHVAAPGAVSDDARYRALVKSCLAFEPVSCHSVFSSNANNDGNDLGARVDQPRSFVSLSSLSSGPPSFSARHHELTSVDSGDKLNHLATSDEFEEPRYSQNIEGKVPQPKGTASFVPSLPPGSTDETELSFQPPVALTSQTGTGNRLDLHKDLALPRASLDARTTDQSHNSDTWETPLEVIPDSQQDEDEGDHTTLEDSIQVDRSFVPDSARQSRKFALDSIEPNSDNEITRIPSSMPSPSPRDSFTNQPALSDSPSNSSLREHSSNLHTVQENPSVSATSLGKRKAVTNDDGSRDSHIEDPKARTSSSNPTPKPRTNSLDLPPKKRPTLPLVTTPISLDHLPIEIRAPDPPVSNAKFRTHITSTLKKLAERMKQSSRFSPRSQTRELHPLERGYWFLPHITIVPDTSTEEVTKAVSIPTIAQQIWTHTFFSQFWFFLREFFTEGRAGWGIWCLLERDASNPSSIDGHTNVSLKLYTWGEVAPHLYLLLFLATERRIKKMKGVVWRDARDESVIIM